VKLLISKVKRETLTLWGNPVPYVFEPSNATGETPQPQEHIDLPFQCISLEMVGGRCITLDDTYHTGNIFLIRTRELKPREYEHMLLVGPNINRYVIVVSRKNFYAVYEKNGRARKSRSDEGPVSYNEFNGITQELLNRVYSRNRGNIKPPLVRTKKGLWKPSEVIYVGGPKSTRPKTDHIIVGKSTTPIVWDHSWRVAGHWRKVSDQTLGLNRNGERKVKGYTWIKEHIKGQGPLKNKIRKVL
jgi:hypothetical protein